MPRAGSLKLVPFDDNLDTRTNEAYLSVASRLPLPIEITVHENLSDAESDWRGFERQADCSVFQTFDWLSTWQLCVGARAGVRPAIVVAHDHGAAPRPHEATPAPQLGAACLRGRAREEPLTATQRPLRIDRCMASMI